MNINLVSASLLNLLISSKSSLVEYLGFLVGLLMEQNTQGRGVARKCFWLLLDYQANTVQVRRCLWDLSLSYAGDLKEEKSCKPGPEPGVWEEQVHSRPQGASVSGVGEHRGCWLFPRLSTWLQGPLHFFTFCPHLLHLPHPPLLLCSITVLSTQLSIHTHFSEIHVELRTLLQNSTWM